MADGNGRTHRMLGLSSDGRSCVVRQGPSHCKFCVSLCICFVILCCIVSSPAEWKSVHAFVPPHPPALGRGSRAASAPSWFSASPRRIARMRSNVKTQLSMLEGDPLAWMAPLLASANLPTVGLNGDALVTQACTAAFFAGLGDVIAQSIASSQEKERRLNENDDKGEVSTSAHTEYDLRRTMNYFLKGLGGGCMWSVWFLLSDPISLELTHRILEATFLHANTELTFAVQNGDIDVATASSISLSTVFPLDLGTAITVSGRDLQHLIRVVLCIALEQFFVSPLFFTVWDIPIPALLSGSPLRQIPAQIKAKLLPLLVANAKVWTPANVITYSLPTEHRVLFASMTDVVWQTILSQITSNEITLRPPRAIPTEPLPEFLASASGIDHESVVTSMGSTSAETPNPTSTVSNQVSSITTPSGAMTSTALFQSNGNET